ncbi:MAG: hypothetical protein ACE5JX_10370 [Acidobacteriota bacterium]
MPLENVSGQLRGKKDLVSGESGPGEHPGMTDVVPVVPYKVLFVDIPFYSDPECRNEVKEARIAILRPLDPDGFDLLDVVPTSKRYKVNQYVNWRLNNKKSWEACYYRDPHTGGIEKAWTLHVEFLGEIISDAALGRERKRIEGLEAKFSEQPATVM